MLEDRETVRRYVRTLVRTAVRPAIHPARAPLTVEAFHVHGEPIGPDAARAATYEPFAVGQAWGGMWDTTWFRMRGTIPLDWAGRRVDARITLGGGGQVGFTAEGLIWDEAGPVQGLHHEHRGDRVTASARGGEPVELLIEAAANPIPPWADLAFPLLMPDPGGPPLYTLGRAELTVVDEEIEALWLDLRVLMPLADRLPEPRASQIHRALHEVARIIDRADVAGTAKAARAVLAPLLTGPATVPHTITAVGHAHIDTAWLWPLRETRRKCARTFANQLRLMEEFPDYRFTCSQAQQYEWIKEGYPSLWNQIVDRVAAGQWEPVGGMWVEADTNLASGESLVRQFVHGKRFFLDEFGIESREVWIPDVFGYSAALPQIATLAGCTSFVTQKMSWNATNRFPHHSFWWQGLDGSRLFTHFPPAATYNGDWTPGEILQSVSAFSDHGRSDRSLYPFGYGDGGGGPTREMLENARRMADLDGLPRIELGTVAEFLDQAQRDARDLAVWVGELYLETHRGTYTTHADVKRGNRRGEEALRAAELWSVAAAAATDDWDGYPDAELDRLWKLLLLHQFHDIIPGSAIHWVYDDSRRDHAAILEGAAGIISRALTTLAGAGQGSVVFNPASHARREVVALPDRGLQLVRVEACGWTPAAVEEARAVDASADGFDNGRVRVRWDGDGLLTEVWDHEHQRDVLAAGRRGNVFQLHDDHPNAFDAWDVDPTYRDRMVDLVDAEHIEVVQSDPLRASLRVERRFGNSRITQLMHVTAGSRRIEFETEVDWQESHRFLKVMFPVAIRSSRASFGIQHGYVERPTVVNTSWDAARFEVCAHRWADLSEAGYGVALLNESKYGYDVRGDELRLSLLRAPSYPDPIADRGIHRFGYALLPHGGDLRVVIEEAEAFNLPLSVVPGSSTGRVLGMDRPGVSVEAVKMADRERAVVVRLCEVRGARGPVTLTPGFPIAGATRTDLLERDLEPLDVREGSVHLTLRPFELVTVKLAL